MQNYLFREEKKLTWCSGKHDGEQIDSHGNSIENW